jgi:hypothetical protein
MYPFHGSMIAVGFGVRGWSPMFFADWSLLVVCHTL